MEGVRTDLAAGCVPRVRRCLGSSNGTRLTNRDPRSRFPPQVSTAVRTQAAARGKVFPREANADATDKQNSLNQARTCSALSAARTQETLCFSLLSSSYLVSAHFCLIRMNRHCVRLLSLKHAAHSRASPFISLTLPRLLPLPPQLKREMQIAAEQERYKDAAVLRDRVKQARAGAPQPSSACRVLAPPSATRRYASVCLSCCRSHTQCLTAWVSLIPSQAELSVLAASAALSAANSTEYKFYLGQARPFIGSNRSICVVSTDYMQ